MNIEQLPLAIRLPDTTSFASFYPGENGATFEALRDFVLAKGELQAEPQHHSCFYLYGEPGSGCSHLLQAACHAVLEQQQMAMYFSLRDLVAQPPAVLDGLEAMQLVALDDLGAIAGNSDWEIGLFHFYNRCRDSGVKLLFGAKKKPQDLSVRLPDLVSRLAWGGVHAVKSLSDKDKRELLQQRAKARGFELSDEVVNYLFNRCSRALPELIEILDKLDRDSIKLKRKVTIPFVKQSLGI